MGTQIERYMEWLEHGRNFSKNTLRDVRADLETFDGNLDEALRFEIESYIMKENKRGMSSATVNRRVSSMRNYMQWLVDNGLREKNPITKHMTPKVRNEHHEAITKAELDELYDNAPQNLKPLIALMGYAGLRISEVAGIGLNNTIYKDDTGALAVHLTNTKGGGERRVSLALVPCESTIESIATTGITGQRGRMSANGLWRKFKDYTDITPHQLRATFSTMLVERDVNVAVVRDALGHSTLEGNSITSRYVKTTTPEQQAKALKEAFGV